MISTIICNICTQNQSKYKCPNCMEPYCSLHCYKIHQENPCEKPEEAQQNYTEDRTPQIRLFTTVDTLKLEDLEKLKDSEPLKDLLRNPHLRDYLKDLDQSPNAWRAMQTAMQEPLFLEFADECLKVIEN